MAFVRCFCKRRCLDSPLVIEKLSDPSLLACPDKHMGSLVSGATSDDDEVTNATSFRGLDTSLVQLQVMLELDNEVASRLGEGLDSPHVSALLLLVVQSVKCGIDYASLGLNWSHPQTRTAYRQADGETFAEPCSVQRREDSKAAMVRLVDALVAQPTIAGRRLVDAFCQEIGAAPSQGAPFEAMSAALKAELRFPLQALNEGVESMTMTYSNLPVPRNLVQRAVDDITLHVLDGTYHEWRYDNAVGRTQLRGLSEAQLAAWRAPKRTVVGPHLVVHEDAPGELGLFWATKIGGPSHGFDYEGQCLLPLLCNARHKVVLVSDEEQWPHNPAGRAHFRLLWAADTEPPQAVLWIEAMHVDFAARDAGVSFSGWQQLVLSHAICRANELGIVLSMDPRLLPLVPQCADAEGGVLQEVADRMVLRPSNGVLEASDYLSDKHDWVQTEEEITEPLHRALYVPLSLVDNMRDNLCGDGWDE